VCAGWDEVSVLKRSKVSASASSLRRFIRALPSSCVVILVFRLQKGRTPKTFRLWQAKPRGSCLREELRTRQN
jgi:hypothetical protein